MEILEPLDITGWEGPFPPEAVARGAAALEEGKVLYAPRLRFELSEAERRFLSPAYLDSKSKNISFRPDQCVVQGTRCQGDDRQDLLLMLKRFFSQARALLTGLCPTYRDRLTAGLTSFRPAQVEGRKTSWRKDDTRLHVDAFPSRPLQGQRILRVFANVNPAGTVRLWRIGEHFEQVAATLVPQIRPPLPGSSWLLQHLKIIKGRRTPYDHFMLNIHDRMKADEQYQANVSQTEVPFPAGAAWACFTDSVSHAAMSGQFAFEQTFYLPVAAMQDPGRSPLRVLERLVGHPLA